MLDHSLLSHFTIPNIFKYVQAHLQTQINNLTLFKDIYHFYKQGGKLTGIHQHINSPKLNQHKNIQLLAYNMSIETHLAHLTQKHENNNIDDHQFDEL